MERHCALIAAVLLSSAAAVSCGGRFPLGSDDSGKCTLNCEAGAAVEGMWDSVWSLDYIPVEIKRNLETLGWTSRGWDECGACECLPP